jgi:hypothetical protein
MTDQIVIGAGFGRTGTASLKEMKYKLNIILTLVERPLFKISQLQL